MDTPSFSEVFKRDNRRCVYCCRDLASNFDAFMIAQLDHLIPAAKVGRLDDLENVVTACCVCIRSRPQ